MFDFKTKNTAIILTANFAPGKLVSIDCVKVYCNLKFRVSEIECLWFFGTLVYQFVGLIFKTTFRQPLSVFRLVDGLSLLSVVSIFVCECVYSVLQPGHRLDFVTYLVKLLPSQKSVLKSFHF